MDFMVNPDAFADQDDLAGLDRVQRMIEEGDLDGAMAELDRMLKSTEDRLSQMSDGEEELGNREYSETQKALTKAYRELEQIEGEQKSLTKKAEKHAGEMLERMKSRMGKPDAFVDKQLKRLADAKKSLEKAEPGAHLVDGDPYDQALRRMEDTKKALEGSDFGAARDMAERSLALLGQLELDTGRRAEQARRFGDFLGHGQSAEEAEREIKKARPLVGDVLKDILKLTPKPEELLSPEERGELSQLEKREQELRARTQQLGEQLQKINDEIPVVGEGAQQMLGEADEAMGESGRGLGEGDAPGAVNQGRRALDALARLKEELEKNARGKGGRGGGMPLPFGLPEMASNDEGPNGDPSSNQKVEIPKADAYKAPAEFREDILEAAKQGTVEAYREAVRRYYEEIVK
jgi:hypothetical protein